MNDRFATIYAWWWLFCWFLGVALLTRAVLLPTWYTTLLVVGYLVFLLLLPYPRRKLP
jgi:hypothetical protein